MVAHLTELVKEVARKSEASLAIIAGVLTEKLQPSDVSPNQFQKPHATAMVRHGWQVDCMLILKAAI